MLCSLLSFVFYFILQFCLPTKHLLGVFKNSFKCCERFEPRSHFKSRLSLIVRVNELIFKCVPVFLIKRKFGNFCFWQEGKTGLPGEKPFRTKERVNNELSPYANKNQRICNVIILKALLFKVFNNFPPPKFSFFCTEREVFGSLMEQLMINTGDTELEVCEWLF